MTTLATAYQCDAQGALIGMTQVQEDPNDPGTFLLPPGATIVAPPNFDPSTSVPVWVDGAWTVRQLPAVPSTSTQPPAAAPTLATAENKPQTGSNEIAVIVSGQWQVLPDFRGTTYWLADGSRHDITEIGETVPAEGLTSPPAPPPPAAPTLAQVLTQQAAMLQAAYLVAIQQPVSFTTAAGVTKTFDADTDSQRTLQTAAQGYEMAGSVPDGFYWVAADNTQVPFTLADLKGLYAAMLAQGWAAFQHLQALKVELQSSTTVSAVQAVVW
ncbi:DUF4376 domain-containing protein [Burkholderia territorii]|uniref:DUF4376 domain-containing protein n=1 Tax=Burkholderia territorii TaxID=1503055 RepID=UPI00075A1A2D|nr:DUF4376 domain-containing protein [Burkholderia territorii]KWO62545.1 hypothetical protein WT98_30205 [Burkholderia territorii]